MNTVDKKEFLAMLEAMTDRQLTLAVDVFQNQSDAWLSAPSPDGGWSVSECLEHLLSYGHYYLPRLRNALDSRTIHKNQNRFTSGWPGRYFIRMMDPKTSRKRYKAAKRHQPNITRPGHQTVAEFIGQLEELLRLIRKAGTADLQRIRIPVSVAPFLTMNGGDTLHFLAVHNQRHIDQALRHGSR
ncbi:DinB family protein [Arsenicibacter rosenii]|uniref:DinB-like domain-containing protein n=1 Tax=Arsenicibacter rosenii TaxID=1750698 RepID=A0A1S2VA96_9BACT|nr:DinB family protein [Arsenicibacter rosenii]OIN55589.1 hypothetical protein BLX24_29320 [Arsenicibacter rosenii]